MKTFAEIERDFVREELPEFALAGWTDFAERIARKMWVQLAVDPVRGGLV